MLRSLLFNNISLSYQSTSKCLIHLNSCLFDKTGKKSESNVGDFEDFEKPKRYLNLKSLKDINLAKDNWIFPKYNRIIYPPQNEDEPRRNAFVHHMRTFIRSDPAKLWYPAAMIRGMSIDEAIKQLSFHKAKGANTIKETIIEAQEMAVKEHNVEYKSNLWVSYSTVGRAKIVHGVRKHAKPRYGILDYKFSHYFVRLEEGKPQEYKTSRYESFEKRAEDYIKYLRNREISVLP